jgi:hypothetical protein
MRPYGLCLLIPAGWDRLDGDGGVAARVLDERWSGYALTEEARSLLMGARAEALRGTAAFGTVLWAVRPVGTGGPEDPLSILSLTVTVHQRTPDPPPWPHRDEDSDTKPAPPPRPRRRVPTSSDTLSSALQEQRFDTTFPGLDHPVPVFQAQAFVVPDDMSVMITVTAVTPDPAREAEARQVTIAVASTLRFQPLPEPAQP